jgi:hypothetical protein
MHCVYNVHNGFFRKNFNYKHIGVKAMTISAKQKERIINLCQHLKDETQKSLKVMTDPELAQKAHLDAAQAFKKTHAAYILAMNAYLNLSRWSHPRLRHRDSVEKALGTLLTQARLITDIKDENTLAINSQLELKQYLNSNASDSVAIEGIKRNADAKPGKQLSSLLMEYTDYQLPSKKAGKKHHHHQDTTAPTNNTTQPKQRPQRLKRKVSEPEENAGNNPSLKGKIGATIKRKASEAETMIKKKSNDALAFLHLPSPDEKQKTSRLGKVRMQAKAKATSTIYRKPSNEKALRVLGITDVFDDPLSASTSTLPRTPIKGSEARHRHQEHQIIKSQEIIKSQDDSSNSNFETIALSSGGTPQKSSTPPSSGEVQRRRHGEKSSDMSSGSPHSPRFWQKKRTARQNIDRDSRSYSSTSLPRVVKK